MERTQNMALSLRREGPQISPMIRYRDQEQPMRMSEDLEAAFNNQLTMELEAANSYLQISAWFATQNLNGMASWMRQQAAEEHSHAVMFLDFILDREGEPIVGQVPAPTTSFDSPLAAFESSLAHEKAVTKAIHELYRAAEQAGDISSIPFLQGFITEQIEEEATASGIVDRLRLAEGHSGALFLIDAQLGGRSGD
jgi:ferritin